MQNKPDKVALIVTQQPQKIAIVTQVKRGVRGTTNVSAIAPIELSQNDEISLRSVVFVQSANLATWIINHNLNRLYPPLIVKDSFGETINGDVRAIDSNNLQIRFNQPVMGTAYLG